jgi:hypothetical protein
MDKSKGQVGGKRQKTGLRDLPRENINVATATASVATSAATVMDKRKRKENKKQKMPPRELPHRQITATASNNDDNVEAVAEAAAKVFAQIGKKRVNPRLRRRMKSYVEFITTSGYSGVNKYLRPKNIICRCCQKVLIDEKRFEKHLNRLHNCTLEKYQNLDVTYPKKFWCALCSERKGALPLVEGDRITHIENVHHMSVEMFDDINEMMTKDAKKRILQEIFNKYFEQ